MPFNAGFQLLGERTRNPDAGVLYTSDETRRVPRVPAKAVGVERIGLRRRFQCNGNSPNAAVWSTASVF